MLDLNGIRVWIADATTGEEHVPFEMQKISSNAITGTVGYSYRNKITLHWCTSNGPSPSSALLQVYVRDGRVNKAPRERASVIYMPVGWQRSQIKSQDLEQSIYSALKFPHRPKHPRAGVVEGSLCLEVYRNPVAFTGDPRELSAEVSPDRLGPPSAVFTFNFVCGRRGAEVGGDDAKEDSGSESDISRDSDFHLPTSPNEGIPVTSRLRPADRINPPRPIYIAGSPPAPTIPAKRKKRPTSSAPFTSRGTTWRADSPRAAAQARRIASPPPSLQGGSRRPSGSSANPSPRVHIPKQPSSSSQLAENGAGPTSQLGRLAKLAREAEAEERIQDDLIARLIKGKEKRLKEDKVINNALRQAVLLMED